jgi:hypothetical protein
MGGDAGALQRVEWLHHAEPSVSQTSTESVTGKPAGREVAREISSRPDGFRKRMQARSLLPCIRQALNVRLLHGWRKALCSMTAPVGVRMQDEHHAGR